MHRRCLKCRQPFQPEHRGLFRCDTCKINQQKIEEEDQKYMGELYADTATVKSGEPTSGAIECVRSIPA